MRSLRARTEAFSLIEMLVVVAIIALLLTIGSPMLFRAMHAARLATCMSNQHQVAMTTQAYMADNLGRLPSMNDVSVGFHHDVLLDPADKNPYVMPALAVGGPKDLAMSYGLNVEYAVYQIGYSRITNPGRKIAWFDGTSGRPGGTASGSEAAADADSSNDGKFTITHIPPGNPAGADPITIATDAADAHLSHGDVVGDWSSAYGFSAAAHVPGAFARRHPVSGDVGVVTFADWHVESRLGLDPDMYASPELTADGGEYLPPADIGSGNG